VGNEKPRRIHDSERSKPFNHAVDQTGERNDTNQIASGLAEPEQVAGDSRAGAAK
jgi:hypothetical protein